MHRPFNAWILCAIFAGSAFLGCSGDNGITTQQATDPVPSVAPAVTSPAAPVGSCKANDFAGTRFVVQDVDGNAVTSNVVLRDCPSLRGEIRRDAVGIREFVGDLSSIDGTRVVINPKNLPGSNRPKVGETLKLIWKPRRNKK